MPRARGTKLYQPLSQGLVTEASPLNFPQGATIDELNFVFDKEGAKRIRRKGLESDMDDRVGVGSTFNMTFWPEQSMYVVYNTNGTDEAMFYVFDESFQYLGFLETYIANDVQFTPIGEDLVVTFSEGNLKPVVLVRNGNVISQSFITIYVRDFELLNDEIAITERPSSLTEEHQYNLYNAGWYQNRKARGNGDTLLDPIDVFNDEISVTVSFASVDLSGNEISTTDDAMLIFQDVTDGTTLTISGSVEAGNNGNTQKTGFSVDLSDPENPVYILEVSKTLVTETGVALTISTGSGAYPSNADIALLGLTYDATADRNYFDPQVLVEQTFGNSPAPRGHYVYDINNFDREERRLAKTLDGAEDDTLTYINQMNF